MNKEFSDYIPMNKQEKENNKYFNYTSGGAKKKEKVEYLDQLMSKKFKEKYLNQKKER